jgi:hypothetical protein
MSEWLKWRDRPENRTARLKMHNEYGKSDIAVRHRWKRRGIIHDDIVAWRNATFLAQDGICAMEDCDNTAVCVDHEHKTGKPRAMLCHVCNKNLGVYESRHVAFEAYLKEYGNG